MTATALARNTDPETFHLAARELKVSGKHANQQATVYRALCKCRLSATSAEIAQRFNLDRYLVARRLPDLLKNGMAEKEGKRRCRVTGKIGVVWKAVK